LFDAGSGFKFSGYSAAEMIGALARAVELYGDAERWNRLVARIMTLDWSWERSARKYMEVYEDIYRKRNPA